MESLLNINAEYSFKALIITHNCVLLIEKQFEIDQITTNQVTHSDCETFRDPEAFRAMSNHRNDITLNNVRKCYE